MSNFIGVVYATLKKEGIDTKDMDTDTAVAKFKELQKKNGGKVGEGEGTPAEKKKVREMRLNDLKEELKTAKGIFGPARIREEIEALENGYDDVEEYRKVKNEEKEKKLKESEKENSKIEEEEKLKRDILREKAPVPKGYTRLYRGLSQKYDKKFDKKNVDNPSYYESWTDNYDLARAYGEKVYYIDVKSSDIKDDVVTKGGNRNFIYENKGKKVGLHNEDGKEYLLYSKHNKYDTLNVQKSNKDKF